jgi:rhodanese-related sulfurtransferase
VKVLLGGLPAWQEAGFGTSTGSKPRTIAYTSSPPEGLVDTKDFIQVATVQNGETLLLDVRSIEEVTQGVITGAVVIPADEVMDRLAEIPYGKRIFIYCKSGVRAAMVYSLLKDKGYTVKYLDKIVTVQGDGSFSIQDHKQKL